MSYDIRFAVKAENGQFVEALKDLHKFVKLKTTQRPAFLDVCEEALMKQIPQKPICYEDKHVHCPHCDEFIGYKWKHYPTEKETFNWLNNCWNCGQALLWTDWSEEC